MNLEGSIPSEVGFLKSLKSLDLMSNQLKIPDLDASTSWKTIELSKNYLKQSVLASLDYLLTMKFWILFHFNEIRKQFYSTSLVEESIYFSSTNKEILLRDMKIVLRLNGFTESNRDLEYQYKDYNSNYMFSLLAKDEALIFNISGTQKEIELKVFL